MTTNRDQYAVDDKKMMRLVDGELSLAEQQEMLRWLDTHPTMWRECALAFLEEQTLRQELATDGSAIPTGLSTGRTTATFALQKPRYVETAEQPSPRATAQASSELSWVKLLSVAAMIMAAFAVGWLFEISRQQGLDPIPAMVDSSVPSLPSSRISRNAQPQVVSHEPTPSQTGYGPYFVTDSNLWENESALPEHVESRLEQMGAEVRRRRGLMPARLPDGRQVTVPYEDIQVVPVSNHSY